MKHAEDRALEALAKYLNSGYRVRKDGASWCATGEGFINLQESNAGFGATPLSALQHLIEEENRCQET